MVCTLDFQLQLNRSNKIQFVFSRTLYFLTLRFFFNKKMSVAASKFKILVTHAEVHEVGLNLLRQTCEVIVIESLPPERTEILNKIKGVHGLFWTAHHKLDLEIINAAGSQLKSVAALSAGVNHIDVEELKKRKISLGHTPTALNAAIADLAIGLMIATARRFQEGRQKIEASNWEHREHIQWMMGQDIYDATVGFYGFGGIAQGIAKRLAGFDVGRILYTARNKVDSQIEEKYCATHVSFDKMLSDSDFVFIAVPLTQETEGAFNSKTFSKMKKNAVLINVARGQIIDHNDLYDALKSEQIFAAGLDVFVPEPFPANHKLLSLPNCVTTPHLGSTTLKTRIDMATITAKNLLCGLADEPMPAQVF